MTDVYGSSSPLHFIGGGLHAHAHAHPHTSQPTALDFSPVPSSPFTPGDEVPPDDVDVSFASSLNFNQRSQHYGSPGIPLAMSSPRTGYFPSIGPSSSTPSGPSTNLSSGEISMNPSPLAVRAARSLSASTSSSPSSSSLSSSLPTAQPGSAHHPSSTLFIPAHTLFTEPFRVPSHPPPPPPPSSSPSSSPSSFLSTSPRSTGSSPGRKRSSISGNQYSRFGRDLVNQPDGPSSPSSSKPESSRSKRGCFAVDSTHDFLAPPTPLRSKSESAFVPNLTSPLNMYRPDDSFLMDVDSPSLSFGTTDRSQSRRSSSSLIDPSSADMANFFVESPAKPFDLLGSPSPISVSPASSSSSSSPALLFGVGAPSSFSSSSASSSSSFPIESTAAMSVQPSTADAFEFTHLNIGSSKGNVSHFAPTATSRRKGPYNRRPTLSALQPSPDFEGMPAPPKSAYPIMMGEREDDEDEDDDDDDNSMANMLYRPNSTGFSSRGPFRRALSTAIESGRPPSAQLPLSRPSLYHHPASSSSPSSVGASGGESCQGSSDMLSSKRNFQRHATYPSADGSPCAGLALDGQKLVGGKTIPKISVKSPLEEKSGFCLNGFENSFVGGFSNQEKVGKILPCKSVKEDGLMRIEPATLHKLLAGGYSSQVTDVHVIDCRFEYEFVGGHIEGAVNITDDAAVEAYFLDKAGKAGLPSPSVSGHPDKNGEIKKMIVVVHCEFSQKRGPEIAKILRKKDRAANTRLYPALHYPEVYILEGGYKCFFETHPTDCNPQAYVKMDDPKFLAKRSTDVQAMRKFHRALSWQGSIPSHSHAHQASLPTLQIKPNPSGITPLAFAAASAAQDARRSISQVGFSSNSSLATKPGGLIKEDDSDSSFDNSFEGLGTLGFTIGDKPRGKRSGGLFATAASNASLGVKPGGQAQGKQSSLKLKPRIPMDRASSSPFLTLGAGRSKNKF
ncbi:M-phase inducer phosphatase [Phaffia rhodozyma]|uniref:M-phase inducer phosphatase n=1 Tax=Phaffia rhodozyma TaxID=264483 RepID=A0A0F7SKI5_PHARH|nr:M-phase inducer phosphatase [Phaffia rhodozyma]